MLNETDETGTQEENAVDIESLRTIFVALDAQVRAIMPSTQSGSWVAKPKANPSSTSLDSHEKLNTATLLAVLQHMECLLNHIHAFNQKTFLRPRSPQAYEDVALEQRHLIHRFERGAHIMRQLWDQAGRSPRDDFLQPLTALELMQCQIEYFLRHPRADIVAKFPCLWAFQQGKEPFTTPFDEAAHFSTIFDLCTQLLGVSGNKAATPVFMTSMGPTAALWFIAVRAPAACQALRRRAVGLMLSHPRREGFWDGMVAGQIASEALSLEQARTRAELGIVDHGSAADLEVPEHLRIISFWLTYPEDEDRRVRVEFSDERDLAVGVPSAFKWFTW